MVVDPDTDLVQPDGWLLAQRPHQSVPIRRPDASQPVRRAGTCRTDPPARPQPRAGTGTSGLTASNPTGNVANQPAVPGGTENGTDAMPSASSDPTTAVPPIGPSAPPGLRLRLDPTLSNGGVLDGGWWPRSRDPDAELPGLIAGLEAAVGPITRVALNLDAWDTAPRRVAVDSRRVHVGWFRPRWTPT